MLDRTKLISMSRLFGFLACLLVTPVVNADGRVFVVNLRNSSGLQGFRDAEQACASQHARLASAQELHHAVVDCFFSPCTRGWLYGGLVGTTVCNFVGSALKPVDVRTENATEDTSHLNAFCIIDRGTPCGDPPSFPNARLQGHSGYEMGDELLYTCVPGYLMPSGHRAFSLLCDSCGEWYGLVEICVKDETEGHVDYEDKFTDSYGEAGHHSVPEEAQGEVYEEVHGAAFPSQEPLKTSFSDKVEDEHQDQHEQHDVDGELIDIKFVRGGKDEERPIEDFVGHPNWEQGSREVVTTDVAPATQAPVSILSQKHLFWFPSEAFQEEGHPISTNPGTQTTQRASGAQSEESKEQESQEGHDHLQHPVHVDDHEHAPDDDDDRDADDGDDHDNNHDDVYTHEDSHHDDQDDPDSQQEEDDREDPIKHYIPAQHDRRDRHEKHDDHDDHYDMGEHEDERDRIRFGSQEYDDRDDTYNENESYEDPEDLTDDQQNPDGSEEHPDRDDHDDDQHEEVGDNDHFSDHDEHDDHEHDDHDSYDDNDSHEDDGHQHVIFSVAKDSPHNITQKATEGKATTDDTWLDGYPVVEEETENGDSTTAGPQPERETPDKPNDVELSRPIPYTDSPETSESHTGPSEEQEGMEEMLPGLTNTPAPSQPSDSPSYLDTLDYDTQQAVPTRPWFGGPTEHPFLDQDPAPPMKDSDVLTGVIEEHTLPILPGERGERGEMEGEMGEAMCTGENCTAPPPTSSSRGPTVAAIIAVICMVAVAVLVGAWCYRRQKQKSSMYEMNGKGQSQSRQGQQIEMQQKV